MEKKIPMRTCIACRAIKPKKELIRIVKAEDGIFLDRTGRKNGRGAYICDDE
ncbi:MAG: YlxR family protein, partial [Clostridia bacterium]|nr:YlxR family protein [Clostridia bacterium]